MTMVQLIEEDQIVQQRRIKGGGSSNSPRGKNGLSTSRSVTLGRSGGSVGSSSARSFTLRLN